MAYNATFGSRGEADAGPCSAVGSWTLGRLSRSASQWALKGFLWLVMVASRGY